MIRWTARIWLVATLMGISGCGDDSGSSDPCKDVDCSGHGRCAVTTEDTAVCLCDPGYRSEGLACVEETDPCAGVACSGHGSCAVQDGEPVCVRDEGYHAQGLECLSDENPCEGVDCTGHGSCVVQDGLAVCVCDEGYHAEGLECVEDEPQPVCGNGVIEPGEDCEAGNLNGMTCADLNFSGGQLDCTNCRFDTSGCVGTNTDSPLGTNLLGIVDYHPYWPFVDIFKTSRPWISGNTNGTWDDGRSLDLDEDGWVRSLQPNQVARTLMFWSSSPHYPGGRYVVLYDGEGTIEYWGAWQRDEAASAPGRDVVVVDPTQGGLGMNITSVNPNDYLRNIRVILPGGVCSNDQFRWCDENHPCDAGASCELFEDNYETQIFHPTFLDRTKRYRVLRFMDWMGTNDSTISSWAERPRATSARWWWTGGGVPVEILVALANRLHADPWFCIPHLADDDYVRNLATYVRDNLDPNLKVYIEYSNEVWNSIFAQGDYAEQQGLALNLSNNPFQARLFFYSRRAVEIFQIFETVFGGTDRLVRVMASQAANDWVSDQELSFENASQYTDALAIAPYFGGYLGHSDQRDRVAAMSVDDLYVELRDVAVPQAIQWIQDQAAVAQTYGVELIAYEGGQHLVGIGPVQNDDTINALFDAINRDPRMGELYTLYLEGWRDNGGHVFVQYTDVYRFTRYGRWGSLEYLDQPRSDAPKYDALMTFIDNNPKWW